MIPLPFRDAFHDDDAVGSRLVFEGVVPDDPVVTIAIPTFNRPELIRETIASAQQAEQIWAGRLAKDPTDFESAWKLARARYWLGGHAPDKTRKGYLESGIAAGRAAICATGRPSTMRITPAGEVGGAPVRSLENGGHGETGQAHTENRSNGDERSSGYTTDVAQSVRGGPRFARQGSPAAGCQRPAATF